MAIVTVTMIMFMEFRGFEGLKVVGSCLSYPSCQKVKRG